MSKKLGFKGIKSRNSNSDLNTEYQDSYYQFYEKGNVDVDETINNDDFFEQSPSSHRTYKQVKITDVLELKDILRYLFIILFVVIFFYVELTTKTKPKQQNVKQDEFKPAELGYRFQKLKEEEKEYKRLQDLQKNAYEKFNIKNINGKIIPVYKFSNDENTLSHEDKTKKSINNNQLRP